MCLFPFKKEYIDRHGHYRTSLCKCGKCPECIKQAQQQLSVLVWRQLCLSKGNAYFVTLTYRDENLPLALTTSKYDIGNPLPSQIDAAVASANVDKMQPLVVSKPVRLGRSPLFTYSRYDDVITPHFDTVFGDIHPWVENCSGDRLRMRENFIRDEYFRANHWNGPSGTNRVCIRCGVPFELSRRFDGTNLLVTRVCTSVDREDVKGWLKRCRLSFERSGGDLTSFKYTGCQEYGPRGHRPHYHFILVGCPEEFLRVLTKDWRLNFGNVEWSIIHHRTCNGGDGYKAAGSYLGAYTKKLAEHDDPSLVAGFSIRPRRCSSKYFGICASSERSDMIESVRKLRERFLAWDVFGSYDPDCLAPEDLENMPDLPPSDPVYVSDLASCLDRIEERRRFNWGSDSFGNPIDMPVPNLIAKYVYKVPVKKKCVIREKTPFKDLPPDVQYLYCSSSGFFVSVGRKTEVLREVHQQSAVSYYLALRQEARHDLLLSQQFAAFAGVPWSPSCFSNASLEERDRFASFLRSENVRRSRELEFALRSKYKKSKISGKTL